ncbi:MAG: DUF1826 domain-containing protein [Myxococcales bacterium]|nr:DUF1826 domain-containing protein [Polyangiaceae bacterium]MDW8248931.1 DUF1826 domain-containing protein [Myxococcales bacterium]
MEASLRVVLGEERRSGDGLDEVRCRGCNQAILRRSLPWEVVRYLERAMGEGMDKVEFEVLDGQLDGAMLTSGLPSGRERIWVQKDVERWGRRFVELTGLPRYHAMLGPVVNDKCKKFHVDYVMLRLLVTYAGPGTELAPDEIVNRQALEAPACCHLEANEAILRDASRVIHARAGDVVVLKGNAWPGNEGLGAVHRSPPVEGRNLRRLVLTLTCFGPSGRPW